MRLISWNVNGLRACLNKGFLDFCTLADADVICLQETKMRPEQASFALEGYHRFWNSADKAGYSGTAVFSRTEPLQVIRQIGSPVADDEGRVCALEFGDFWFVDVYTPNSKQGLARLDERMVWDERFREFLQGLDRQKPVVTCGDFNVAHEEIDLKNPATNHENAGFSDAERESFTKLLESGLVDTFRERHPNLAGAYSWWSYRMRARERGIGWRIDYFLVSPQLMPKVTGTAILDNVFGSDHCPIELELEL